MRVASLLACPLWYALAHMILQHVGSRLLLFLPQLYFRCEQDLTYKPDISLEAGESIGG